MLDAVIGLVEAEIAKVDGLLREGVKREDVYGSLIAAANADSEAPTSER